jgi:hypothetical protein
MSKTISVGVVGPSHWSYMASIMADRLGRIAETKTIEPSKIPRLVYTDALEFYRLVMQAAGDDPPDNPPASMNAYSIAADGVRASAPDQSSTPEEIHKTLADHLSLLECLTKQRPLDEHELETVKSLRRFFLWLKSEGETEAYERGVHNESFATMLRIY